jgi:hypothetical protein
VNPWLLIAAAGGLLALAASKSAAPAPTIAPAPLPQGGGPSGPALTATNIQRAFLVAMRTEKNPANLVAFGNALITYGYPKQGGELLAQAAKVAAPPPAPAPVTGPLPPDAKVDPSSGYVTSKSMGGLIGRMDQSGGFVPVGGGQVTDPKTGKPVAGTSEFGPSGAGLGKNDINYWVNRYAKTSLKVGDLPTKEQIAAAVKNAMAHETNAGNLLTFAGILQAYGYGASGTAYAKSDAGRVEAKGVSEQAQALVPWVKKYAGTTHVDEKTLQAAIDGAKKHASPSDLAAFGAALLGFSDFDLDWTEQGTELTLLAPQRAVQQAEHGGHHP